MQIEDLTCYYCEPSVECQFASIICNKELTLDEAENKVASINEDFRQDAETYKKNIELVKRKLEAHEKEFEHVVKER